MCSVSLFVDLQIVCLQILCCNSVSWPKNLHLPTPLSGKLFKFTDSTTYNRFQNFAALAYVKKELGLDCPFCSHVWIPDKPSKSKSPNTKCPACKKSFCKNCLRAGHKGECDDDLVAAVQTKSEMPLNAESLRRQQEVHQSLVAIANSAKKCPGPDCRALIQKNGGCNHMTCTQCKYEFCWLDGKPWSDACRAAHQFNIGFEKRVTRAAAAAADHREQQQQQQQQEKQQNIIEPAALDEIPDV